MSANEATARSHLHVVGDDETSLVQEQPLVGRHATEPAVNEPRARRMVVTVLSVGVLMVLLFAAALANRVFSDAQSDINALEATVAEQAAVIEADKAEMLALEAEIDTKEGELAVSVDSETHQAAVDELDALKIEAAALAVKIEADEVAFQHTLEQMQAQINSAAEANARLETDLARETGRANGLQSTLNTERGYAAARLEAALDSAAGETTEGKISVGFTYTPDYTQLDFGFWTWDIGREEYEFVGDGTVEYGLRSDSVLQRSVGNGLTVELQMPVVSDAHFKMGDIDEDSRLWFGASAVQVLTGSDTSRKPLRVYAEEQLGGLACQNVAMLRTQATAVESRVVAATSGQEVDIVWRDRNGVRHQALTDQLLLDNAC